VFTTALLPELRESVLSSSRRTDAAIACSGVLQLISVTAHHWHLADRGWDAEGAMACSEENFKGWARPQRRDSQPEQGSASQRKGRLQVAPNALLSAWPAHGSSRAAKRELARRSKPLRQVPLPQAPRCLLVPAGEPTAWASATLQLVVRPGSSHRIAPWRRAEAAPSPLNVARGVLA